MAGASRHPPRHYRTGTVEQGAGVTEEQAPPHKDGQAQYVFRAGGVRRLRRKAVLLHDQLFRGTARPLCLLQLQEQHEDLLGPLYPGRGAGKAGAGTPATDSPVSVSYTHLDVYKKQS